MKRYTGATMYVRIGGPGIENCKSTSLKLDEEHAIIVAKALDELNKQCDPSLFIGWITTGYVEESD